MVVFSVLIFALSTLIIFKDIDSDAEKLTAFSVIFVVVILVLTIILFFGVVKFAEYYENKQTMSLLALRNQMLEESIKETEKTFFLWKASLHDYKHNIFHLITLLKNNNIDELKNYLEKENELLTQKLFYYKTGNDTVDTIVNIKQALAREYGIVFLVNAAMPEKCRVTDAHLSSILGNLIDNAINTSRIETEPYIELCAAQIEDFFIIKVSNRFSGANRELKSKNEQGFHGIGLKSVRYIVKEYDGDFTAGIENDLFIAQVMIPVYN
jgi:hypothetical protein